MASLVEGIGTEVIAPEPEPTALGAVASETTQADSTAPSSSKVVGRSLLPEPSRTPSLRSWARLPLANVARVMGRSLPSGVKISKEAKECMCDLAGEMAALVTMEASCWQAGSSRAVTTATLLHACTTLGLDALIPTLKTWLEHSSRSKPTTAVRPTGDTDGLAVDAAAITALLFDSDRTLERGGEEGMDDEDGEDDAEEEEDDDGEEENDEEEDEEEGEEEGEGEDKNEVEKVQSMQDVDHGPDHGRPSRGKRKR